MFERMQKPGRWLPAAVLLSAAVLFGAGAIPAAAQTGTPALPGTPPATGWGMMSNNGGMMDGMRGGGMMGGSGGMMSDSDRHFIEQMIPHHQAAVVMADLALQKAQRPEIKALATRIKRVQTAEIAQMRAWYKQWYGSDVPTTNLGNAGGMMGHMTRCPMLGGSVADLTTATDFDKAFIAAMIPHHQMALMMSNMVLAHGGKAELNNLARSIITSQSAEIQQMRTWYQQWYNAVP